MKPFELTVTSDRSFDEVVGAIGSGTAAKGFRVLYTHDVAATLAEKGFAREPLKIIEICNARYASLVLEKDPRISLMLPCPISVYTRAGKTHITTMLPSAISSFFPDAGVDDVAAEVEAIILSIIDGAK